MKPTRTMKELITDNQTLRKRLVEIEICVANAAQTLASTWEGRYDESDSNKPLKELLAINGVRALLSRRKEQAIYEAQDEAKEEWIWLG